MFGPGEDREVARGSVGARVCWRTAAGLRERTGSAAAQWRFSGG
ncbi:hypothetical protein ACFPM0_08880 [Pseudonocardia sulfidoxydans]